MRQVLGTADVREQSDSLIPCKGNRALRLSVSRAFAYDTDINLALRSDQFAYFRLVTACSTNTSTQFLALNSRIKRGSLPRV
jgi:hypothetical protein